jgi:pyruvate-ferredoxin/flavodoxin oxidoreductase
MGKAQENIKDAVECGYWSLYRYNPELEDAGKNPFVLDSKEPTGNFRQFIMDQVRYSSLAKEFPEVADQLFAQTEKEARLRYAKYKRLADQAPIV